jgi:probable HAF family extracellular repeat protein
MRPLTVSAFLLVSMATASARAQASFEGLGDLPGGWVSSQVNGISADGAVAVGWSSSCFGCTEAFRWTGAGGMVGLGFFPGQDYSAARGTSADGSVVVGTALPGTNLPQEAFYWTAQTGLVLLGSSAHPHCCVPVGNASSVSADGTVIVGGGFNSIPATEAFRWTPGTGMVGLGDLPGGSFSSFANGVSADGSAVAGDSSSAAGGQAFRWTAQTGMVGLGDLPGGLFASMSGGISADGLVIVGTGRTSLGSEAFRWTAQTGMAGLGQLFLGSHASRAFAVSGDGSIVVGASATGSLDQACVWSAGDKMRRVYDVLVEEHGLDLSGWHLSNASGISADGRTIVGNGTHSGDSLGWIATLPAVCVDGLDNDGDGAVDMADPGCVTPNDFSERTGQPCDDGLDNDGDGHVDHPDDPGCQSASFLLEAPRCQNGINDDGQLGIDFDGGLSATGSVLDVPDPQCVGVPYKNKESAPSGCGLGFEVGLVTAVLMRLRSARRRRTR